MTENVEATKHTGKKMKRYNNLYEKIYNMENIILAHKNARKGKKHYSEVNMVDNNPDYYFKQVYDMLKNCILLKQTNPLKEVLI